ncbi:hypothetical protein ACWEK7_07355, partial [Streptomyces californicus]
SRAVPNGSAPSVAFMLTLSTPFGAGGRGAPASQERSAGAALTGRTALVVAHRLTQAVAADRVVVLEAGRVVESGPHEMLRDADGPYAALWRAWSGSRAAPHP